MLLISDCTCSIKINEECVLEQCIQCMCDLPSSLFDWCDLSLKIGVVYANEDGWGGCVQLRDHLRRQKQL